jgi:hypothetical protein
MKLPCKDPVTVPWMSQREIPAIKAVLSAWRKARRDPVFRAAERAQPPFTDPQLIADTAARIAAGKLDIIAAIDERLRKEAKNGRA